MAQGRFVRDKIIGKTALQQFPVDLDHSVVMLGLDPSIHHHCKIYAKKMDTRVKPAGDGGGWACTDSRSIGNCRRALVPVMSNHFRRHGLNMPRRSEAKPRSSLMDRIGAIYGRSLLGVPRTLSKWLVVVHVS
jgi:hypothetical protein